MLAGFPGLYNDSPEVRMMFRANHLYILFSAMINLSLALNKIDSSGNVMRLAVRISSALVILGGILLAAAFFIEPASANWNRPLTFYGVVFHLIGILIIVINKFIYKQNTD